jgi:hypothetical protein
MYSATRNWWQRGRDDSAWAALDLVGKQQISILKFARATWCQKTGKHDQFNWPSSFNRKHILQDSLPVPNLFFSCN